MVGRGLDGPLRRLLVPGVHAVQFSGRIEDHDGTHGWGARRRRALSPRLSLTPRNKAQLAATCRYSVKAPARKEVVENAGDEGDRRQELKILVSAVQSRPCPPFFLNPPEDFRAGKGTPKQIDELASAFG